MIECVLKIINTVFYTLENKGYWLELIKFIGYLFGGFFIWRQIRIQNKQRLDGLFRDAYELLTSDNKQKQMIGIENIYDLAKRYKNYETRSRVANALCIFLRSVPNEETDFYARDLCIYRLFFKKNEKQIFQDKKINYWLKGANLSEANFFNCSFKDVDLEDCNIKNTSFIKCNFEGVSNLSEQNIKEAKFIDCEGVYNNE